MGSLAAKTRFYLIQLYQTCEPIHPPSQKRDLAHNCQNRTYQKDNLVWISKRIIIDKLTMTNILSVLQKEKTPSPLVVLSSTVSAIASVTSCNKIGQLSRKVKSSNTISYQLNVEK